MSTLIEQVAKEICLKYDTTIFSVIQGSFLTLFSYMYI